MTLGPGETRGQDPQASQAAVAPPRRVHGGNPWALMRASGCSLEALTDLSLDINPLGFPASVRAAILGGLDQVRCYPDPEAWGFREAVAAAHGVSPDHVLPGNGSAELIQLLATAQPVGRALVVVPTFGEYEWALRHRAWSIAYAATAEEDGFRLRWSPGAWSRAFGRVNLVFLCNPNNPTGVALPRDEVLALAAWCREMGARLVVDEAYVDVVEHPEAVSVAGAVPGCESLVVLRSLTKSFAVPGLRLGYALAAPALVEELRAWQPAWPLNALALAVGPPLLREAAFLVETRACVARWRAALSEMLAVIPGVRPLPSVVNFLLCAFRHPALTATALAGALAERRVLIRAGDSFRGLAPGRFIRIAVGTPAEQAQLHEALCAALGLPRPAVAGVASESGS